jgi:hypothetical protein
MQNAPLQAGRFFSVSTNSPTLRRDVQQFGGGRLVDFAILQICRLPFTVLIFPSIAASCHIRQLCGNDGALAFVQVTTAEATLSRDLPPSINGVNFSPFFGRPLRSSCLSFAAWRSSGSSFFSFYEFGKRFCCVFCTLNRRPISARVGVPSITGTLLLPVMITPFAPLFFGISFSIRPSCTAKRSAVRRRRIGLFPHLPYSANLQIWSLRRPIRADFLSSCLPTLPQ